MPNKRKIGIIGTMSLLVLGGLAACGTKHSHEWLAATYTWSEDNTTCTAQRVCKGDATHVETETVTATYSVTTQPTCEGQGSGSYVATFQNSAFASQTKNVTLNAKGHNFAKPTYSWSVDHHTCNATRVCQNDTTHIESESVNAEYAIVTPSSCTEKGLGRYTATFTNPAFTTQTYEEEIDKQDHEYDEGEITTYPSIYEYGVKTYHCKHCSATKQEQVDKVVDATNYTLDATRMEGLTGVYTAKAVIGANKATDTIGIPELAKQNLADYPTYRSPGIIQGAAVDYETRLGPTDYQPIPGKELVAPYEYFRYTITEVETKDADGNITKHKKPSGFDGTYYIVRLDVSDIIAGQSGYLHVKHTDNKALMVLVGMLDGVDTGKAATDASGTATTRPTIKNNKWYMGDEDLNIPAKPYHNDSLAYAGTNGNWFVGGQGFGDGMGARVATYSLDNNAEALKDKTGNYKDTPYIDIIVLSSGKLAAGADAGKETAPTSDISLSFYIDDEFDYNPSLVYDPASQDVNHVTNVMAKFYDDTKASSGRNLTSYITKGSDLEIDVVTKETRDEQDIDEFWSLTKAMDFQDYNEHTIKLMCEVPVLESLHVKSHNEEHRQVILDVNSFDIQIANHSETNEAGLIVSNNASLEILDNSNTVGAELAIGNNATMEIRNGGTFIVDNTCQLEVEYDAASVIHDTTHYDPAEVIAKINALPDPANVKEADRATIVAAQDAYNALTEEEKAVFDTTALQRLNDCLAALPEETPLTNGVITVKDGGKLINEGIINIEGLEVKPQANNQQETHQVVDRDMKAAALLVEEGGILDNHGCMGIRGDLYLLGTLNNYGRYNDLIEAQDPDKGTVNHHKGIQVSWKDDVTVLKEGSTTEYTYNPDVRPGTVHVGIDDHGIVHNTATLNNYGDIVLMPGKLEVYGVYSNAKNTDDSAGNLYLSDVGEAIVPITPDPNDPTKLEERRTFSPKYPSTLDLAHAVSYTNYGTVAYVEVQLLHNGIYGEMTILLTQ